MGKLKIYLDTSVISHLNAEDTPEKMQDTLKFWENVKSNKFDVFISEKTLVEIGKCYESKRLFMIEELSKINYIKLDFDKESDVLSQIYLSTGTLKMKSKDDAIHIAIASKNRCDVILSWNFKHFVNPKIINMVLRVNLSEGYKVPTIVTPKSILEMEDD
ncbi:MAG: hypothetical protein Pg6B_04740 [Candidatus Azobacteroides pseudotrichonymphae]|uniref:Type II toxin-antitoxin system VapC family toxin n=1 Tax=Candidatus Improbicoccus pseudotrichonymphae TaxID=3033792 RepID=A0AA48I8E2_9FIRM|nr:MAG: type II toxin-antitoxin system VapC family toxin [Candidatus Improbicoccus pseudotrichonymphae]GMO34378.1 MAG: hypothetical protein Pg6B_04740 [Candidatus Azobacteroides pseudotrichonymphae]